MHISLSSSYNFTNKEQTCLTVNNEEKKEKKKKLIQQNATI